MKFCKIVMLTVFMASLSFMLPAKEKSTVQNLYLEQLSVEDGLSQGTVNAILADESGFIWLATDNGLNVYDGYSFKQLPGPNNIFLDSAIHFVKQDAEGRVWINVNDALYRYQPSNNEYQQVIVNSPDSDGHYVVDVTQGKSGVNQSGYWIATNKTIGFYHPETLQFQIKLDLSKKLSNKGNISQIKYHRQVLYIATRAGIYAYHTKKKKWRKLPNLTTSADNKHFKLPEATKSYTLYISEQNELFFGTNDGVFSVKIDNIKEYILGRDKLAPYKLILKNLSVWSFLFTDGKLYVASNRGLHAIDTTKQFGEFLFGVSDYFENTSDNKIISITRDNSGVFWLGSESKGVYLWDPSREIIKNYRYQREDENSLSDNAVWAVQKHNNNANLFWVGTSNGFNLIDHQQKKLQRHLLASSVENQFSDNHIYQIFNYNKGLLLSTSNGIVFYNTQLNQVAKLGFDEEVNKILASDHYSVFLQKQRYLWLAYVDGATLIDLQLGEKISLAALNKVVPLTNIYHFLGSLPNSDAVLFSTNDSLWSYDLATNEVIKLYQHPNVLTSEWLAFDNWTIDKNNVFWLSYPGKGLVGLELPSFKAKYFYHSNNSIIDNNVYSLLTDSDGDIWFSSHKGVSLLNSDNQHIRNFTIDDGFPAMEFNAGARLQLTNGKLVYGSMEGISVFDPLQLKNKRVDNDLKIYVTNIAVISRALSLPLIINQQQEIQLEYNDVGISFDFSTLSYRGNQGVIFEYQLTGDSKVDYPPTTENKITFPSLPSGEHTLSVKAKSPITGEYSATSHIKIKVSYAPWQSPFAYFVYTVSLLSLIFIWLYQRNLQRFKLVKAHEEVKFRENRLQLALIGSNSEVWDWQAHDNLMFGKRIAQELDYVDLATAHSFEQHVELIHPEDKENFLSNWQEFVAQNNLDETFSCTYRLKHAAGHWLWYKDLGKIVTLDGNNQPSRITGSYTNITQTRAEEVRSQYYGEAFKQTNDWVLIVNADHTQVTANQSLRSVFGWTDEDFDFNSNLMGLSKRRWQFFQALIPSLEEGEHWRGEELVVTGTGKEFHVIVNINVGRNKITNGLHYVFVFSDISAQKAAEKELRYLANYDYLTDLPNRSLLLERIKHAMEVSKRKKRAIALFFIDLDRFKQVNDSLGHDCGDLLLVEVSRRLSGLLRADDTVARIGGDEFVVLLETFKGTQHLGRIAQKIISAVEQPVLLQENQVSIGASIGIALYPEDASDSSELLRHADIAMYHAKQLGRNTFQFFTSRMNLEASERLEKESNVKLAYANDEFFNHYQPIIDADNGKAAGFELLMRWQSKQGLIAPVGFIAVAEELGLIIPMTEAALERGLIDLKKWHQLRPILYLSVNLSPQHFAKEGLVKYIATLLKNHNLPAHLLKIEVTESALFSEPEKAIKTMKALSELGVVLALDDFGTGFSSLSYLKRLPLDIIKIDRSFIAGIGIEKADEAIVDATIVLAKRLNMHCIAEGVETTEQLAYLTQRRCHYIQGYLYSKPVDAQTITDYLTANIVELKVN
ncbi:MAG: EAL domain-containing protein [Colwellia sp.]|nr:EAL domain-containing protein [Colwellia sp.]